MAEAPRHKIADNAVENNPFPTLRARQRLAKRVRCGDQERENAVENKHVPLVSRLPGGQPKRSTTPPCNCPLTNVFINILLNSHHM